ncbi:hypothetical protein BKA62DRAFT_625232 [Auriculariales sp. MPI-PUGE-AT-0066]|nr:hypothetical protein BKA62DRAFT_625232 [Auriculariales sp. MPI-PUGE-AT-0066]
MAKPGGPGSTPRHTATNFDDNDDDPDLDELERRVLELKRELERARLTRDRALSRRAPMRKVPNELLARVFELGAYGDIFFATTLCEVNRHWRDLAIVTPSVWANVVLNPQWQLGIDAFLRRMTVFLERAQHCLLLVDLDLYCVDNEQRAHDVLQAIAPHVSRCFSFSISVPQPEWMDFIGQHFGGEMATKMEKMALRFKPTSPWAAAYVQSTILQGAMPLLHTLCLEGLPLTILDAALPGLRTLEYKQFEDLYSYPQNSAAITPLSDLTNLLRLSESLEELKVEYCSFCTPDESLFGDPDPQVPLRKLASLTIGYVDAGFATLLMEAIDAPNLTKLSLRCDPMRQHQDSWWIPVNWSPLRGLTSLYLDGFRILDGSPLIALVKLLSVTQQLRTLSIHTPVTIANHTTASPQFFAGLSKQNRQGQWLCPYLVDFTIINCSAVTGQELLNIVRARDQALNVATIGSLTIKECTSFDVMMLDELVQHVQYLTHVPPTSPPVIPPTPNWNHGSFFT